MALRLVGTFPVSSLNLGLSSAQLGLGTVTAKLQGDVASLQALITTSGKIEFIPPSPAGFAAAATLTFNAANVAAMVNPAVFAAAVLAFDPPTAELGTINGLLGGLNPIVADLKTGLTAPDLSGWTYRGRTGGFGPSLAASTRNGLPLATAKAGDQIDALVIATRSFQSWSTFGEGFEVGDTAGQDLGSAPTLEQLRYLGTLRGEQWNIGAKAGLEPLERLRIELEGAKLTFNSQFDFATGGDLPSPEAQLEAAGTVDVDGAFDNFVNAKADLDADVSGVQTRIEANAELIAELGLQLAAGGLTFWSYRGRADGLGAALEAELRQGLPGTTDGPDGACYGLAIATANAAAWQSFGLITATG